MTRNVLERLEGRLPYRAYEAFPTLQESEPTLQGWNEFFSASGTGSWVADDLGEPAWYANGTNGRATWTASPNAELHAMAASEGWHFTSTFRVASGGFITNYYGDGSQRYLYNVSLNGNSLDVSIEGETVHTLIAEDLAAATDYHRHDVIYEPASGLATYYFDGKSVASWSGSASAQNFLAFGNGSTPASGEAYYRDVSFVVPEAGFQTGLFAALACMSGWARRRSLKEVP